MEKKMKISELANYYIERYNIEPKKEEEGNGFRDLEDLLSYNITQQIKRQLQRTRINNVSIYDTLKAKGQKGPRQIYLNDFEDYCFDDFFKYIITRLKDYDYDEKTLQDDYEKHLDRTGRPYWEQASKEAQKSEKEYFMNLDPVEQFEQDQNLEYEVVCTDEEIEQKKHYMMIEAIYNLFYEEFRSNKLEKDMRDYKDFQIVQGETGADVMRLKNQLDNYKNYIGNRKGFPVE